MEKIPENYQLGSVESMSIDDIIAAITDMYTKLAIAVNKKTDFYERTTDGQTDDYSYSNGSINLNTTTNKTEILVKHNNDSTVTWKEI